MLNKELYYINLYDRPIVEGPPIFSAEGLTKIFGVIFFALLIYGLVQGYQQSTVSSALDKMKEQYNSIAENLDSIIDMQSSLTIDKDLAAEVEAMEKEVEMKEQLLGQLQSVVMINHTGFSEHLVALAGQWREGMWVTEFSLTEGGEIIEIKGKTKSAKALPKFLSRLGSERAFKAMSFDEMSIIREGETEILDFVIKSHEESTDERKEIVANKNSQNAERNAGLEFKNSIGNTIGKPIGE